MPGQFRQTAPFSGIWKASCHRIIIQAFDMALVRDATASLSYNGDSDAKSVTRQQDFDHTMLWHAWQSKAEYHDTDTGTCTNKHSWFS